MDNLRKKGLILKAVFQKLDPGTIRDLIDLPDAVKILLRDGGLLLARLNEDNSLRLDEIDEVC